MALGIVLALLGNFSTSAARAGEAVVGINFTHPLTLSVEEQNADLALLKSEDVRVIRIGFYAADADKGVDFIRRASAQNIQVLLTVHSQYMPNAPLRAYQPKEFHGIWSAHPLSFADPELSRKYFQQLLDSLDAQGIALAGLELENEINTPGFNGEFPLPGEGKNFGFDDLNHDPGGQRIAKGYLQYLKVLAVLKQVRDHSKVNRRTPLISAGLSNTGAEGPWSKKYDAVSINGTLQFLRANGLDRLVDAYGIHTYPWANSPGDRAAAIHRLRRLQQEDLAECGVGGGKPCWVTEWGFRNTTRSCPAEEAGNSLLVQEIMSDFRQLAAAQRLRGVFYYTWTGEPAFDAYRCGELTEPGKLALRPL